MAARGGHSDSAAGAQDLQGVSQHDMVQELIDAEKHIDDLLRRGSAGGGHAESGAQKPLEGAQGAQAARALAEQERQLDGALGDGVAASLYETPNLMYQPRGDSLRGEGARPPTGQSDGLKEPDTKSTWGVQSHV